MLVRSFCLQEGGQDPGGWRTPRALLCAAGILLASCLFFFSNRFFLFTGNPGARRNITRGRCKRQFTGECCRITASLVSLIVFLALAGLGEHYNCFAPHDFVEGMCRNRQLDHLPSSTFPSLNVPHGAICTQERASLELHEAGRAITQVGDRGDNVSSRACSGLGGRQVASRARRSYEALPGMPVACPPIWTAIGRSSGEGNSPGHERVAVVEAYVHGSGEGASPERGHVAIVSDPVHMVQSGFGGGASLKAVGKIDAWRSLFVRGRGYLPSRRTSTRVFTQLTGVLSLGHARRVADISTTSEAPRSRLGTEGVMDGRGHYSDSVVSFNVPTPASASQTAAAEHEPPVKVPDKSQTRSELGADGNGEIRLRPDAGEMDKFMQVLGPQVGRALDVNGAIELRVLQFFREACGLPEHATPMGPRLLSSNTASASVDLPGERRDDTDAAAVPTPLHPEMANHEDVKRRIAPDGGAPASAQSKAELQVERLRRQLLEAEAQLAAARHAYSSFAAAGTMPASHSDADAKAKMT